MNIELISSLVSISETVSHSITVYFWHEALYKFVVFGKLWYEYWDFFLFFVGICIGTSTHKRTGLPDKQRVWEV